MPTIVGIFIFISRENFMLSWVDDDEFRFNDASSLEGHLRQNDVLTWFCNETAIMISHSAELSMKKFDNLLWVLVYSCQP